MTLAIWQARLKAHFGDLRRLRSASVGDKPIFALEHGLEVADLEALTADIRAHIARAAPFNDHPLPWIAYAAELGYRYAGDEYWQTFAEETTGWEVYGNRDWLRDCFSAFHKQFGGARPSGPWANQFSIICWPITHAVLPLDLQRQLAEILYHMRDLFSAELLTSPMALGEQIAARSWNATSRFQNLAQEPLLIGQIATALLLQGAQSSESLILPATLRRIVTDLDRARIARDWLRDAQRVAQQRVQFRGLSSERTHSAELGRSSSADRAREQVAALAIEPRLMLRPTRADGWDVLLELPDLSHLLVRFPALRTVLTELRCVVAGCSARPLARGALLHGPQQLLLRTWPNPSDVLLRFEQPVPPDVEYLLRAECLLRPGPRWLFRIASDGLAYELRGHLVRPGQSYVLASSGGPFKAAPGVTPNHMTCEGVHGARLDVPAAVSGEWAGHLKDLGLSKARSVHVWPAGLAAAGWDGEGRAEWLTSERPCIGIRADHAVDSITVTLGSAVAQRLQAASPAPGVPIYVELPPLSVGVHAFRVSARAIGSAAEEQDGRLDVVIREPRAWKPGMSASGALRISVDPPVPTLEELWEGRMTIEIRGPAGRRISPTLSLFERRADGASVRKRLPPLPLPVDAARWRAHFEKLFRDAKDVQNLYDPAHTCQLQLNAEELGTFSLTCEREFSPLRWVVRRRGHGYELSLLDDSGSAPPPNISRYEFTAPDSATQLEAAQFSTCYTAPPSGGLYRASVGTHEPAVIVPPAARNLTLRELSVEPQVRRRPGSIAALEDLLSLIRMWSEARLTGLFSAAKGRAVLISLVHEVFAVIGGESWASAERRLRAQDGSAALAALNRAISNKAPGTSLAEKLLLDCVAYVALGMIERVAWFASTVRSVLQPQLPAPAAVVHAAGGVTEIRRGSGPEHPDWIYEFALRLASSPRTIQTWAAQNLQHGLGRLLDLTTLARAARFLVLAIDRDPHASAASGGQIYRGWGWE